jgi:predicted nucleotidyltransferase
MRLRQEQAEIIRRAVHEVFGPGTEVLLFGSRVDDSKRGGDIDLLIRPDAAFAEELLRKKIRLLGKLEHDLGERKIDIVIEHPGQSRAIERIARETGIKL